MFRRLAATAVGTMLLAAQPAHAYWRGGVWIDVPLVVPGPYYYGSPYYGYPQPPVIIQQAPPQQVAPAQPAPPASWYWCANPAGYYPYVRDCPGGWQAVPAGAPPAPSTAQGSGAVPPSPPPTQAP